MTASFWFVLLSFGFVKDLQSSHACAGQPDNFGSASSPLLRFSLISGFITSSKFDPEMALYALLVSISQFLDPTCLHLDP